MHLISVDTFLQVLDNVALLIRPDGHIACRFTVDSQDGGDHVQHDLEVAAAICRSIEDKLVAALRMFVNSRK